MAPPVLGTLARSLVEDEETRQELRHSERGFGAEGGRGAFMAPEKHPGRGGSRPIRGPDGPDARSGRDGRFWERSPCPPG